MTTLILASAILAANLAAEPVKPAAPAIPSTAQPVPQPAKSAGPGTAEKKASDSAKPNAAPASPEALKDAVSSLLGPCAPEMAGGKVTAIEVLDGIELNRLREIEKSSKPKAEPMQRFIKIAYEAGGKKGTSIRQVSTHFMLTTEQAQKLLGEKLCVFQED